MGHYFFCPSGFRSGFDRVLIGVDLNIYKIHIDYIKIKRLS